MNRIEQLTRAYDRAVDSFKEIMSAECSVRFKEEYIDNSDYDNSIALGDNLEYMEYLIKERNLAGRIQMIYVDPPFFAGEKYMSSIRLDSELLGMSPVIKISGYNDRKGDDFESYLYKLALRIMMMRVLLTDSGSIWVHLDRHTTHYVKIILDMIFGEANFINEIIWQYKSGGAGKRSFARKHDNILGYGKTKKYLFNPLQEKSYNREYKPYRFKGVEEFEDEIGWYTLVNMKDVWAIDMVGRTSAERQGYATQKPEKLVGRIIEACSNEGDLCADFYGGSGTLAAVCSGINRHFISSDSNPAAVAAQIYRMHKLNAGFRIENAGGWPEGKVCISADGLITDYCAPLDNVDSSAPEVLERYMAEDGKSFIRFFEEGEDESGTYVFGYDVLGNRFKSYHVKLCENER